MDEIQKLKLEADRLNKELEQEFNSKYSRLDSLNMTVGPIITYDDLIRVHLYIKYRKGIHNPLTEKANHIEELKYQIDLLNKNVESRQSLIRAIIASIPDGCFKE